MNVRLTPFRRDRLNRGLALCRKSDKAEGLDSGRDPVLDAGLRLLNK